MVIEKIIIGDHDYEEVGYLAIPVADKRYHQAPGVWHRTDGPALIRKDNNGNIIFKCWMLRGKFHREDGPAIEDADGRCQWYYFGKEHTFEDWCKILKKPSSTAIMLKLQYF